MCRGSALRISSVYLCPGAFPHRHRAALKPLVIVLPIDQARLPILSHVTQRMRRLQEITAQPVLVDQVKGRG